MAQHAKARHSKSTVSSLPPATPRVSHLHHKHALPHRHQVGQVSGTHTTQADNVPETSSRDSSSSSSTPYDLSACACSGLGEHPPQHNSLPHGRGLCLIFGDTVLPQSLLLPHETVSLATLSAASQVQTSLSLSEACGAACP